MEFPKKNAATRGPLALSLERRYRPSRPAFLLTSSLAVLFAVGFALSLAAALPALIPVGSAGPLGANLPPATSGSASFPTPIRHVITVLLENEEAPTVLAQGAYEKSLATQYAYASHYYAVSHPSAPNYLSLTSGSEFTQSGSDTYHVYSSVNIADLVEGAGLTWGQFAESMPVPCDTHDAGLYAVRHAPLTWYADIVNNKTRCDSHLLDFTAWDADVAAGTIPNYAFIAPNLIDDGHNSGIAGADSWLKSWLPPLLNASWFASSVFLIVYDEGKTSVGYNGTHGGNVYLTVVSPFSNMASVATADFSHYDLLTTTEWLLGLGTCGHNDNPTQWPAMKGMFSLSSTPPPQTYSVTGTVTGPGGAPLTGATVSVSGTSTNVTTTNLTGGFSFRLPNGSYVAQATAAGLLPATQAFSVAGSSVIGLSLVLSPSSQPTFNVSGTVQSSVTALPIAGATVSALGGGGNFSRLAGPDGSFSIALPNGSYTLSASAIGFLSSTQAVTVAGASVAGVVLRLNPVVVPLADFEVNGSIYTYPTNAPVAGATVAINVTGPHNSTASSATGNYTFSVTNGTYLLSVTAAGFHPASTNLTITGFARPNFDLIVYPVQTSVYRVEGTVTDANTGAPLPNVTITVSVGGVQANTGASANGGFFTSLPNGTYLATISAPGFATAVQWITVRAGTDVDLRLALLPPSPLVNLPGASPSDASSIILLAAAVVGLLAGEVALVAFIRRPPKPGRPDLRAWIGAAVRRIRRD